MLTQFSLSCCSLSADLCEMGTDGNVLLVGGKEFLLLKCSPSLNDILPSINVSLAHLITLAQNALATQV